MKKEIKENICERCGKESQHVHHKDHNHKNNKADNLELLCTLCHAKEHGITPKIGELRRLVDLRDRMIRTRIVLKNQIFGLGNIELVVPEFWDIKTKEFNAEIKSVENKIKELIKTGQYEEWKWLQEIKGISEITASKFISYLDSAKFTTISKMWRYCGLDASHIKRTKKISQEEAKKFGNPYMKKELLGVLADGFIKHRTPKYRQIYDEEKSKQLAAGLKKGHAHRRAIRKMIKHFISDYWVATRTIKGLSVSMPYAIEHLEKHTHYVPPFAIEKITA